MKKLLLLLICFVFLINTKVFAESVDFPNDDLTEVFNVNTSNYYQRHFYRLEPNVKHIFLSVSSKEKLYCLRETSGSIGYGYVTVFGTNTEPSKIDINVNTATLLAGVNYNVYNYSAYYYGGTLKIPAIDFVSEEALISFLNSYSSFDAMYKDNVVLEEDEDDSKLPMLHYKLSSKNVISFPNIIDKKLSIDWDFSSLEPYASDPMAYAIEIIISANFYPNSEGQRICWDASNSAINQSCKRVLESSGSLLQKPFTFIYLREGDALYSSSNHIFATDELQDGYYLYLRTYSKDGTKSSNYKVYKCTTGGTSGQMDLTYDTDGKEYPLEESDRDEDSNYSNEYDEDSSSSADKTPTGDSYDGNGGYTFDTLYGNLTSMVNMLQGVPELWMYVMSWLPSWFPTFIVTMMGLLIVIGVLKYIF